MGEKDKYRDLTLLKGIDLQGQTAIVTGAGQGIGKATAHVLARAGCNVVIGEINPETGATTAEEIRDVGGNAVSVEMDVALPQDTKRLATTALEHYGSIDILANIAGLYPAALVHEMREEQWDRVYDVNIKGIFNCCQAVLPTMMANKSGRIVSIASVDGMQPGILAGRSGYGNSHYCSSKGAVITFTKCLAAEMAPHGINVNAISPGWVATETALAGGRFYEGLTSVPMGRGADPAEVGQIVLFLCSEAASFMTGENLVFSGGCVMD